jgi:hypothetical protein
VRVIAVLIAVGLAAAYVPSMRATRVIRLSACDGNEPDERR